MKNLKRNFDRTGFAVIKNFLNSEEVAEIQHECARFTSEVVPNLPDDIVYYDDKTKSSTLKQVQKLYKFDDYFLNLAQSKKIVALAQKLLGGEVELQNMQYFNKVPGTNEATPPHQDGFYFMIKPQAALTMWLSLGEADAANGAVCYLPGSHLHGMRPHVNTTTLGFSQEISNWSDADRSEELQMTASAGDLLVHHSLTVHRANRNSSNRDRISLGFIFYRTDVVIDKDAHARYKTELNKRLRDSSKI